MHAARERRDKYHTIRAAAIASEYDPVCRGVDTLRNLTHLIGHDLA